MAHNRGRTGPERVLASAIWLRGFRYLTSEGYKARFGKALPGKPDLVFTRIKVVVFVDGCFWHGCPTCDRVPDNMSEFWLKKIRGNVERDKRVTAALEDEGWLVIRVPEHAVRTKAGIAETVERVAKRLGQARKGRGR